MYFQCAILLVACIGHLCQVGEAAARWKRQYGGDDIDPVTGVLLATCTFYGDHTVDCSGRLRCHPRDVDDRVTASNLDRLCPRETGQRSGTWDRDQVIPTNMISGSGSGRIAQCKFYANYQQGKFTCTSAQGDTWKGEYTGTINTAFKLGLPLTGYGTASTPSPYGYVTRRWSGSDDSYYRTTARPSYYGSDDYYRTTYRPSYTNDRDRDGYRRDSYDPAGNQFSTNLGYGDRDPTYRDNSVYNRDSGRDRDYAATSGSGRYPTQQTESEVTMCTYTTDGRGVCRDCTERVDRTETDREIRTARQYTCRGVETPATWSERSGLIPDRVPNPYAVKRHAATCIFRTTPGKTFECHSGSTDGGCSLSGTSDSTGYGSSSYGGGTSSAQKCLTGDKWTGTYSGGIYNN